MGPRTRRMLMALFLFISGLAAAQEAPAPPAAAVQPSPPNPGAERDKRFKQCMMDADKRMQPVQLELMRLVQAMPSDLMRRPALLLQVWVIQYQDLLAEACQLTVQTTFLEQSSASPELIEAARQRSNEAHERKYGLDRRIRDYAEWAGIRTINF